VIVAPGGGHNQLVIDKEGWDIAEWLNNQGIAAFVLKYRLARAKESKYTIREHAWMDASRSVRLVRSRAKEWGVDPARIGFMGFSAGGEVAMAAELKFDAGMRNPMDDVDRVSSRPDFAVVVYPGPRPTGFTVPADAPPTFIVCADDDRSHILHATDLYLDLFTQKVSSEMHIYAGGAHGFGMRPNKLAVGTWPDRLREWFVDRKITQP
jgi:endo-1,4-beta-xylanase